MAFNQSSTGGQTFSDRFGDLIFDFGKSFSDGFIMEKFAPDVPAPAAPDATTATGANTWALAAVAAVIGVTVAVIVAKV